MGGIVKELMIGSETDGRTVELWKDCPRRDILRDFSHGYYHSTDWLAPPTFASATGQMGYYTFQDTSATVQGLDRQGGWLELATAGGTDNDQASYQYGTTLSAPFSISTSTPKPLWHESKIRLSNIIETGVFTGLALKNTSVNNGVLVDNTGAVADTSLIGWHCPMHASAAVFSLVYRKTSSAAVTMYATGLTAVVAADAYLGFSFDGRYIRGFANRVLVVTYDVTTASNFPTAQLAPCLHVKAGEGSAKTIAEDWTETFQVR
jgi:hypothetical protein